MAGLLIVGVPHIFADQESENDKVNQLIEAVSNHGLSSIIGNTSDWPEITTSYAGKDDEVHEQKAELSNAVSDALKKRALNHSIQKDSKALQEEAKLLLEINKILWDAGGYRNQCLALLCEQLVAYRCGQIVLLSKGEDTGPLSINRSAEDLVEVFRNGVLTIENYSEGKMDKLALDKYKLASWIEVLSQLQKDYPVHSKNGSSPGNLGFRLRPIGSILEEDDLCALISSSGWNSAIDNSIIPALSYFLKNGGSLEKLKANPASIKEYKQVMGKEQYRYQKTPLIRGTVNGGDLVTFVSICESPQKIHDTLFGTSSK